MARALHLIVLPRCTVCVLYTPAIRKRHPPLNRKFPIAALLLGAQVNVLISIVIIIGGLGSTLGCFVGALMVGLLANDAGFLAPEVALFSNLGLMIALLLWRPQGLHPVTSR